MIDPREALDPFRCMEREAAARAAKTAERAAIVAWLRMVGETPPGHGDWGQAEACKIACTFLADCIERGEHLTSKGEE